eukprot:NODE_11600_length_1276_cov_2.754569.p2 GENE.NODE_11600_length_1276_cov_2.754569~~NODE_11600_length_1276_cov_2.754569.p2  ORF type:complete len:334 (+),score=76.19 NODE_11600_length_1276_cov_2.754569:88-1002(+)
MPDITLGMPTSTGSRLGPAAGGALGRLPVGMVGALPQQQQQPRPALGPQGPPGPQCLQDPQGGRLPLNPVQQAPPSGSGGGGGGGCSSDVPGLLPLMAPPPGGAVDSSMLSATALFASAAASPGSALRAQSPALSTTMPRAHSRANFMAQQQPLAAGQLLAQPPPQGQGPPQQGWSQGAALAGSPPGGLLLGTAPAAQVPQQGLHGPQGPLIGLHGGGAQLASPPSGQQPRVPTAAGMPRSPGVSPSAQTRHVSPVPMPVNVPGMPMLSARQSLPSARRPNPQQPQLLVKPQAVSPNPAAGASV